MSCVLLYALISLKDHELVLAYCILALLSVLACLEKLSTLLNTMSVERDWVVFTLLLCTLYRSDV